MLRILIFFKLVLVEVLKKRIYRDPPFGILPGSLTSIGFFIPPPVICIEILNGGLVFFWKSLFLFDKQVIKILTFFLNPKQTDHHSRSIRTIEEVHIEKGTPGATSEYSTSYTAEKGFLHNYAYGWKSKNNYGNAPEMIWYHFRDAFMPAEVTFRSNGMFTLYCN